MNRRQFFRTVALSGIPFLMGQYDFLKEYRDYRYIRPVKCRRAARIVSCRDERCVSDDFSIDGGRAPPGCCAEACGNTPESAPRPRRCEASSPPFGPTCGWR
ncbi:MAG: hypothetical protein JXA20_12390 [Spirochaetes bacterium]|nr:hypothetical protein [Spirochaetota bacterium]